MLEILDSLIATVAVVLVLSLIVQAIQQIIKQVWSFKSNYMERELWAMFQQQVIPFDEVVAEKKLINLRPIALQVRQLRKGDEVTENLIALLRSKLDAVGYNDLSLLETMNKKEVKKLLGVISSDLGKELKSAAKETLEKGEKLKQAIEKAKDDVENWYDLTLKAFQDHYERRMKMWSYVLSLVVVVGLNASLFDIYKEFSNNRALRESAIALGSKLTSMPRDSVIINQVAGKIDTTVVTKSAEELKMEIKKNLDDIKAMLDDQSFQVMRWDRPAKLGWPLQGLGWLAMTLLVGLGAPFWYDLLKMIMGIKDKLKNKEESKK